MLKEQYGKVKTFVEDHKLELALGVGLVITATSVVICKGQITDLAKIALDSLQREERRIEFEMQELIESIDRLKQDAPINKFDRIPRRLARIEELKVDLEYIRGKIEEVLSKRP